MEISASVTQRRRLLQQNPCYLIQYYLSLPVQAIAWKLVYPSQTTRDKRALSPLMGLSAVHFSLPTRTPADSKLRQNPVHKPTASPLLQVARVRAKCNLSPNRM